MTHKRSTITNKGDQLSSISGEDGIDVMRIRTLMLSINMLVISGFTLTKALKMATEYTGQTYKRSESDARRAHADLGKIMQLRLRHIEVVEAV